MKKYSNHYEGIDQKIVKQIRCLATKLTRSISVRASMEREDIEQEFILSILESIDAYDEAKGRLSTFTTHVLRNKVNHIIEKLYTEKRGSGKCCLSEWENDIYYDPTDSIYLSADLDRVSRYMPEPLASLLEQLKTHNLCEISRLTKVPQSTLFHSLKKLRAYLRKHGFYMYL